MIDLKSKLIQGKGKTMMTVFPHPDDESMVAGGLLIAAKKAGWKTVVVSLTAGGAGKIYISGNGRSLKEIRRDELIGAAKVMGVSEVVIGDFDDGKLKQELWWKSWVDEMLVKYLPDVVVTYDPSGFYGHPDHIVVSKYLLDSFRKQTKWQLWYVAVSDLIRHRWNIPGMTEVLTQMVRPTLRLDYGWDWVTKWKAVRVHKSQGLGKDLPIPLWLFIALNHFEWYHEVNKQSGYKFRFIDYKL